jgi:hypothetical protein
MRSDKSQALKLRLSGRSYSEINRLLGIPKATLSGWFNKLELPDKAKERIAQRVYKRSVSAILKHNLKQTFVAQQRARNVRNIAKSEIVDINDRDLFMLGVSLYWAEGYKRPIMQNGKIKTHHPVSLSNSDPALIKIYLEFLRKVCHVPETKITGEVRVYEHHNEAYLLSFWNKTTNIPLNQLKTVKNGVSISSQRIRPYNTLPYGTIQIRVNSTELYHRIMGWIEGLAKI